MKTITARRNPVAKWVSGLQLSPEDQQFVLRAYIYRHTGDHPSPMHSNLPLQFSNDQDWLKHSLFPVKANGRLDQRHRFIESHPTWPNNPELQKKYASINDQLIYKPQAFTLGSQTAPRANPRRYNRGGALVGDDERKRWVKNFLPLNQLWRQNASAKDLENGDVSAFVNNNRNLIDKAIRRELGEHKPNPKRFWEVIVGNVGKVHEGSSKTEALKHYNEYVDQSKRGYGRAAGESVSLWLDNEPVQEFIGKIDRQSGGFEDADLPTLNPKIPASAKVRVFKGKSPQYNIFFKSPRGWHYFRWFEKTGPTEFVTNISDQTSFAGFGVEQKQVPDALFDWIKSVRH